RGFYHAVVTEDLTGSPGSDVVDVLITIHEGSAVVVTDLGLILDGLTLPPADEARLRSDLVLKPGDVFEEERYERGRATLRAWFRQRGYARVVVEKHARVDGRD